MSTQEKQLSKKAIKLLKLTRNQIVKTPKAYNQNYSGGEKKTGKKPTCNSPACILGWMIHFQAKSLKNPKQALKNLDYCDADYDGASGFLGLTNGQAENLFFSYKWPEKFTQDEDGCSLDGDEIPASLAAQRIDHFIQTDGAE